MARFVRAIGKVLAHEGGYVNDPNDPGGETKYGISRRAHPDAWKDGPPTEHQARQIYHEAYWAVLRLGSLTEQALADKLLDVAVNVGTRRAARWFQQSINDLRRLQDHPPIAVDGRVGPQTLRAAGRFNQIDAHQLVVRIAFRQLQHYARLAASDESYAAFLEGWRQRAWYKVKEEE